MRLQNGETVVDYYPAKSWDTGITNPDKFLKVVTYNGKTCGKEVIDRRRMNRQINNRLARRWKAISNNTLPQFVQGL